MTAEELKQQKARNMRYKRPMMKYMNLDYIRDRLWEMRDAVSDVQWFADDEDNLVSALAGDEDEAWEFKMAFSDLAAELEQFEADLDDAWIPDCFDDLFPAVEMDGVMLGYDTYEHDYFGIDPYEYGAASKEAEKRICRLTKDELLDAVGACLRVYAAFTAVQYRYDCLEASLNIVRGQNMERLKLIKAIEEQYQKAEDDKWRSWSSEVNKLDKLLREVPQEYWIQ